ncbi:hypothetical protein PGTUg99_018199 [Puccinia graminis f. sp. tritici]|uniref:Uncharacterized protein n=1 Tax=Puccinia graminis f. sp. tritici TaxID=56615 RepID=A0A5B0MSW9_PUCGR|nr:hypothetical protein PGTUg99_018199 [Puccinia graminis f. sp. tritici]
MTQHGKKGKKKFNRWLTRDRRVLGKPINADRGYPSGKEGLSSNEISILSSLEVEGGGLRGGVGRGDWVLDEWVVRIIEWVRLARGFQDGDRVRGHPRIVEKMLEFEYGNVSVGWRGMGDVAEG